MSGDAGDSGRCTRRLDQQRTTPGCNQHALMARAGTELSWNVPLLVPFPVERARSALARTPRVGALSPYLKPMIKSASRPLSAAGVP